MKKGLVLGFAALWVIPALAQPVAPVYPSYEGYKPNDDGTYTLVFGYFNPNNVAVTIPAGEANGFEPGPDDRGQPTTFLPGRQRNVCLVVVGSEFEGRNLQWTVEWGGEVVATTERGGPDPLYLLEEVGFAYRQAQEIDTATAARGVCVNTPPTLFVSGGVQAVVGEPTEIRARINDDGLPRGSSVAVRWSKVSGPGEVAIVGATTPSPTFTFSLAGAYELEVSATDGEISRQVAVAVRVADSVP